MTPYIPMFLLRKIVDQFYTVLSFEQSEAKIVKHFTILESEISKRILTDSPEWEHYLKAKCVTLINSESQPVASAVADEVATYLRQVTDDILTDLKFEQRTNALQIQLFINCLFMDQVDAASLIQDWLEQRQSSELLIGMAVAKMFQDVVYRETLNMKPGKNNQAMIIPAVMNSKIPTPEG